MFIAGKVTRVSFLNVDHFAHLNKDQGGVKQEFDVALKRCVISVKSQRTPLHMVHVFSNVTPGRYLVQFRIRLPDSRLAFLYRNSHGDSPTPVHIKGNLNLLSSKDYPDLVKYISTEQLLHLQLLFQCAKYLGLTHANVMTQSARM